MRGEGGGEAVLVNEYWRVWGLSSGDEARDVEARLEAKPPRPAPKELLRPRSRFRLVGERSEGEERAMSAASACISASASAWL